MLQDENKYLVKKKIDGQDYHYIDITKAAKDANVDLSKLPYSLKILFENVTRATADVKILKAFGSWIKDRKSTQEIPYYPARVLMQDFTGVPAIVDLASMRDAMKSLGGDPAKINPLIPVDLVIDHSVSVDKFGTKDAFSKNVNIEMERNRERYEFLKWGQKSFDNFKVVPPGTGICHQVNLEYLAKSVWQRKYDFGTLIYPDTLVGTDSHTTMINALAVLGWGVGGIEAEAAMLGQSIPMIIPEVVGFKLTGKLQQNITATDLVLNITQQLRKHGVVGKFVEFFGSGLDELSLADRATIANMAPEYGATCGYFPADSETIRYLKFTGRSAHECSIVEEYSKLQGLWRDNTVASYTDILEIDISKIEPSLAGPKRPQDKVLLSQMKSNFNDNLKTLSLKGEAKPEKAKVNGKDFSIASGDVVIAAITSCTNTSNPSVMIAAGLVAKKAYELGLSVKPWVKTSLAPGSQVVTEYLKKSGLNKYLDEMGFNLVGYGCTTCIGNSGPLDENIDKTIIDNKLVVASVLSGNRNFEGRVHPAVRANYLASPPLVVAYALAGTVDINIDKEPIAKSKDGKDVYFKDIWPSRDEVIKCMNENVTSSMFIEKYKDVFKGDEHWQAIEVQHSNTYSWQSKSTYINNPPYFVKIKDSKEEVRPINNAKILALFGDSITTDHISPAGVISKEGPTAKYLTDNGITHIDFNSYGSRRGNHEVMMRGTFANIRIKNLLCPGTEGGVTMNFLSGKQMSIYDAAMDYIKNDIPLIVMAGAEYGTGSSRDWAAKGTNLLGIKAVVAESFERIHRSNLVGMGVLPITFNKGDKWQNLGLKGDEDISIKGLEGDIKPHHKLKLNISKDGKLVKEIDVNLEAYTDIEIEYIKHGSILGAVIRKLFKMSNS